MDVAIGLTAVNDETQRRVGRDACLLTAWWIIVGVACSAALLEVVGIRSPLWRYPLTAVAMYAIGDVVGMRIWLALFGRAARAAPSRHRGATDEERARAPAWSRPSCSRGVRGGHARSHAPVRRRRRDSLDDLHRSRRPGRGRPGLLTTAHGLGAEALMAELAMQLVFGRAIGRAVLPPAPPGASWPMIVRETWAQGVSFVVLGAALGATLVVALPGAVSLRDLPP